MDNNPTGFINFLVSLDKPPRDIAAFSKLRRGIGDKFTDIHADIAPLLSHFVEANEFKNYSLFALVGSLFANHPNHFRNKTSLGQSFANITHSDSLEKRFKSLLRAQGDEVIIRLREVVSLVKAHDEPLDYVQLLYDLQEWNDEKQKIQFRWARDYWRERFDKDLLTELEAEANEALEEREKPLPDDKKRKGEEKQIFLKQYQFIAYLNRLAQDHAALATLRCGLGKPLGDIEMLPHIAPFLPETYFKTDYSAYFLVASLFGLHPKNTNEPYHNIGTVYHKFIEPYEKDKVPQSLIKRFVALLDADVRDMSYHLRQAVSLAKDEEVAINYQQLLQDVLSWGNPQKSVQQQWTKSFWNPRKTSKQTENESTDS